MIKNYVTIAKRNLLRHQGNTIINALSLIVGVASAIVIFKVLTYELSFDKFHTFTDRTYRIVRVTKDDDPKERRAGVSYPLPAALKEEVKQIDLLARMDFLQRVQVEVLNQKGVVTKRFDEKGSAVVTDPTFFKIFDFNNTNFRWVEGNATTALTAPNSVVLTRTIAEKYFGKESPLGQTIRVDKKDVFTVTGVTEDLPQHSDFPFKLFFSYATIDQSTKGKPNDDWWSVSDDFQCFVTITPGADVAEVNEAIARVHKSKVPKELSENRIYKLQPLTEIHSEPTFGNFKNRTVSENTLLVLAFACVVLLLVGCINFVNLSTAQATLRAREVGVRKVLGGKRFQLFSQFLVETFILVSISCVFAVFVAELFLRNFSDLLNYSLEAPLLGDIDVLKFVALVIVAITLLAGFYPSLIMSGFNPLQAIKNLSNDGSDQAGILRRSLVVLQFTLTQVFIICAFVVARQMQFFQSKDLGFDRDAVINVPLPEWQPGQLTTFRDKLESNSSFNEVSFSLSTPSGSLRPQWYTEIKKKGFDEGYIFEYQSVDQKYIDLYGMKLVAGRNFLPGDTSKSIIINETLAKSAGFLTVEEAIGQNFVVTGGPTLKVVGVIKDFHTNSLRDDLDNVALLVAPNHYRMASIKLNENGRSYEDIKEAIAFLEQTWSSTYPEYVFEYMFIDDNIAGFYESERKLATLSKIAGFVFLVIGCLGLFGLISFIIDRRMKEVAVRKVLGASMNAIVALLSRDYLRLILLSFLIGAPIAYFVMNEWLSNFEFKIVISWMILMLPCILVLLVAGLAVSGKLIRAARVNPANVLKHE